MNVFRLTPKRIKRSNGQILTPEMEIIVTVKSSATPFYNGAKEIQEAYMQKYGYDYKKAGCSANDFNYERLG